MRDSKEKSPEDADRKDLERVKRVGGRGGGKGETGKKRGHKQERSCTVHEAMSTAEQISMQL